VRVIAHRGSSAAEPENTLAAFARAKRDGATAIELDARVCGSGEVVVFHDDTLERLTDGKGAVRRTPLSELRNLKVAGRERIPTLEDVLRSDDRPPGLVIELKTDRWNDVVVAAKVAKLVHATGGHPNGPLTVSSFNPFALNILRRISPQIPRALLAEAKGPIPLRKLWFARLIAPRELHLQASMITKRLVESARHHGRFVIAWTVNDLAEGERLRALGVDGLITDVPERFVGVDTPAPRA
jgi:glycerophosphoryl diester phosphodiesterase